MGVKFKIHKNRLKFIGKELKIQVAVILNRAAMNHEAISKELAHVLTGFMRNSIQQIKIAEPGDLTAILAVGAEYGIYEELGTIFRPGHPFFRPGFDQTAPQVLKELTSVLDGK